MPLFIICDVFVKKPLFFFGKTDERVLVEKLIVFRTLVYFTHLALVTSYIYIIHPQMRKVNINIHHMRKFGDLHKKVRLNLVIITKGRCENVFRENS